MFTSLTLRGRAATLLWGYRSTAVLTAWTIAKSGGGWQLSATVARADRFQCQQAATRKELLFTAPRDKGRWCWEVTTIDLGTTELRATLGHPLQ